jgi:hypothetical protein
MSVAICTTTASARRRDFTAVLSTIIAIRDW